MIHIDPARNGDSLLTFWLPGIIAGLGLAMASLLNKSGKAGLSAVLALMCQNVV